MYFIDNEHYIAKCEAAYDRLNPLDVDADLCQDEDDTELEQENNETECDHECPYCNYQCNYCLGV